MFMTRIRQSRAYILCLVCGVFWAGIVHAKHQADLATEQAEYRIEAEADAREVADKIENKFRMMYEGLRTMARLPGVRRIDRYAKHFDADAKRTVQEIYNNLASSVAMSEVYIVPLSLEPDRIDPHTGKTETPITTFDQLIVGRNADAKKEDEEKPEPTVPEIEIYEYRLMKKQLAWLRQHYPREEQISGLESPAICGPEVITCDNSRYHPSAPNDKDRSGLVYSTPFYDMEGRLKGCISGVILTHSFRDMLPAGHYALRNTAFNYTAPPHESGQWQASRSYVERSTPDPRLRYSRLLRLNVTDVTGNWALWAGQPDSLFWARGDVQSAQRFAMLGYSAAGLLSLGLSAITFLMQRHRRLIQQQNQLLEAQVQERTASLRRSEAQHKAVVDTAGDGILTLDAEGNICSFNRAAAQIFGYAGEEVIGQNISLLIPNADSAANNAPLFSASRTADGNMSGPGLEVYGQRRDSTTFPLEIAVSSMEQDGQTRFVGILRDITERRRYQEQIAAQVLQLQENSANLEEQQAELESQREEVMEANEKLANSNAQLMEAVQQLEALATTDGLTGLKNHRAFQERLAEECQRARRYGNALSLILLDVDKFKQFNDAFGHPAGDAVLKQFAALLQARVRQTDVAARYGGEEFAMILTETDEATARKAAEQIRATLEAGPWRQRAITASLGVATLQEGIDSPSALVQAADRALYRSKLAGRNCVTHANAPMQNEAADLQGDTSKPYSDIIAQMTRLQADSFQSASEQIREAMAHAYDATITSWSRLLDLKDKETEGHSERVTELTVRLAKRIGMNSEEILYVRWGALLHDVGKMAVPDNILHKPGPLTEEEWIVMRAHTVVAYELLSPVAFLRPALDIPYSHHEKWDGTGYPQGLKGDDIPLTARLFAVVDVYDALTNDRPYRKAWSKEKVIAHIMELQGTHFDPRAVRLFLSEIGEDGSSALPQAA